MGNKLGSLALLGALLLYSSVAAASPGEYQVQGLLRLPPTSSVEGDPLALFADWSTGAALVLSAPLLQVHEYAANDLALDTPAASWRHQWHLDERSYLLHNATLSLREARAPGFAGIYPRDGHLEMMPDAGLVLEARSSSGIGNGRTPENAGEPDPRGRFYNQSVRGPALYASASGSVTYQGAGWLKISNALLHQESATNASDIDARWSQGGPVGEATHRWVILAFEDASVTLVSGAPIEAILPSATFSAENLHAPHGLRPLSGGAVVPRLVGDLSGRAEPDPMSRTIMRLRLAGDFGPPATPLATMANAPNAPGGLSPWTAAGLSVGLVATGVVVAGTLAAVRKRALRPTPTRVVIDADALVQESLMRAFIAEQEGDVDRALAHYDEAAMMAPSGMPMLRAAFACARVGRDDEAAALFVAALRRTPDLAHLLNDEPLLRDLVLCRRDCMEALGAALQGLPK